jgi:hypothetical protein
MKNLGHKLAGNLELIQKACAYYNITPLDHSVAPFWSSVFRTVISNLIPSCQYLLKSGTSAVLPSI